MKIQFQKQEVRVCAVWPIRLMYAGATFEMPDYCLLVVNSRRGRDLGPPRPDTFRRGSGASDARGPGAVRTHNVDRYRYVFRKAGHVVESTHASACTDQPEEVYLRNISSKRRNDPRPLPNETLPRRFASGGSRRAVDLTYKLRSSIF